MIQCVLDPQLEGCGFHCLFTPELEALPLHNMYCEDLWIEVLNSKTDEWVRIQELSS